jgi:hypothetical protein
MLAQRGAVAGVVVRLALLAHGLQAQQRIEEAARLAPHAGGLGEDLRLAPGVVRVQRHLAQAGGGILRGGDVEGGEAAFHGIGREQGGDIGESDAVAQGPRLRRVLERQRQDAAQGVDGAVVDVELELDGGVGLVVCLS